jgi:PAS domain S-box-containing protein
VYYYPKRGILIAGVCGIIYEIIGYFFYYPNPDALIATVGQAILFIVVAAIIAQLIEQVRRGTSRYQRLFENSRYGMICFHRHDLVICQCNTMFATLLHYPAEELTTMTILDILSETTEKERFSEQLTTSNTFDNFATSFITKNGKPCQVAISGSPLDDRSICCTIMYRDADTLSDPSVQETILKYRQLTDHSPTGILIVRQGIIQYANPAFSQFSGYLSEDITGKEITLFIEPEDREMFTTFAKRWEEPGARPDQIVCRCRSRLGEKKPCTLHTATVVHANNPATLINIIDLSEKQQLEERIQQENDRRRGIIMTVAHELRTPLQPILGYLNLLVLDSESYGLTEDTKNILERCLTSVERERQIINRMLDLSVLESGKLQLSYSIFSLAALMRSVIDVSGYAAKDDIIKDIPEDLTISADMDRLFIVLEALLSNAITYSKSPRTIRIRYYSSEKDPLHHLSVQDNGIGIPKNAITSIFEPFQLADAAKLSRKYNRIGLSLSITKKIMELHGGDITVESWEREGSTFTIHLPKAKPQAP